MSHLLSAIAIEVLSALLVAAAVAVFRRLVRRREERTA
jgi:hypothetical protein